jgi:hypothetical protein
VEFWNGMEWNTENLEYYSNIWAVFRNTIRILTGKKAILRNTSKNCTRAVFRNTEVLSDKKKKEKQLLLLSDYILKDTTNMHCTKEKYYLKCGTPSILYNTLTDLHTHEFSLILI